MKRALVKLINRQPIAAAFYRLGARLLRAGLNTPPGQLLVGMIRTHRFVCSIVHSTDRPQMARVLRVFYSQSSGRIGRDFLLTLLEAVTSGQGRQGHVVCFPKDDSCSSADLLAISSLCPSVSQVTLAWNAAEVRDLVQRYWLRAEADAALAAMDGSRDAVGIVNSQLKHVLTSGWGSHRFVIPHASYVLAREYLKGLGPHILAVAVQPPLFLDVDGDARRLEWLRNLHAPDNVRFIVLDTSFPWLSGEARPDATRIHLNAIGWPLLDALAIVPQCDLFIGPLDLYAVVAADAGVPMIIVDDAGNCADIPDAAPEPGRFAVLDLDDLHGLTEELITYCRKRAEPAEPSAPTPAPLLCRQ